MKIMSFNTQHCLNFVTREIDFEVMAKAITDCGADIVGLNEMYGQGVLPKFTEQVKMLSEKTGLPYYYFAKAIEVGEGNPYGNALLSRYPILSAETFLVPDPLCPCGSDFYESRCLLQATLSNGYTVLVIHFGLNPDEQQNAVETVLSHLKEEKCILMGDFNVEPQDRVLDPIRLRMVDTAIRFDVPKLSFPSDKPEIKIDYIFVSPDIKVVAADIPAIVASDHRPHTAEIA